MTTTTATEPTTVIDTLIDELREQIRLHGGSIQRISDLHVTPELWCAAAELAGLHENEIVYAGIVPGDIVWAFLANMPQDRFADVLDAV